MKRFVLTLLAICVLVATPRAFAADGGEPADLPCSSVAEGTVPMATHTEKAAPFSLQIDNADVFSGMTNSYQNGYVPVTENGVCRIILPLKGEGGPSSITASVNLGDPSTSPFVFENYEKTVSLEEHETESGAKRLCYLVDLSLPLTENAASGRYPVTITCTGTDSDSQPFQQVFVVYATIRTEDPDSSPAPSETPDLTDNPDSPAPLPGPGEDGGDTPADPAPGTDPGSYDPGSGGGSGASPTEAPVLQPKLMLTSYSVAPSPAIAGEPFTITFTLTNTSEKQLAQNILLTIAGETADVVPAGESGSLYYRKIAPGKSVTATVSMTTAPATAPGPQKIQISAGYDDSKGTAYTSQETAAVQVRQPVRFEVDEPDIPATVHAGDTINLSINVMNLGRATVSNVMAQVDAEGLVAQNTLFLGNVESGTAKKGTLYVFVRPPEAEDGKTQYGTMDGTLIVTCEDEYGEVYTEALPFSTYAEAPVISAETTEEPEAEEEPKNQWWISLVIAGLIAAAAFAVWGIMHRKRADEDDEDD